MKVFQRCIIATFPMFKQRYLSRVVMVKSIPVASIHSMQRRYFCQKFDDDAQSLELVEAKVFETLKGAAKCDQSKLNRTASFEDLGFDSLDTVELVCAMEENFGFDLPGAEAEKIRTVMDAIQIFHQNYTKNKLIKEADKAHNEDK